MSGPATARTAAMELVVLGSGTSFPVPDRALPGHALLAGDLTVLLDGGAGTGRQLAKAGISLANLDLVCYTHRHLDHVSDLPQLLFTFAIPRFGRSKPLTVVGPPGFRAYVDELRRVHAPWLETPYGLEVRELLDDTLAFGDLRIEARETRHVKPSVAYRIERAGRILVYSGDTAECPEIVEAGRGADLFLLECAVPDDDPVDIHLTPTRCGRVGAAAAPGRLVLTHFYPAVFGTGITDRVRRAGYAGPLDIADDLARFRLR